MYEWRRIYHKKTVALVVVLLLCNLFFFIRSQLGDENTREVKEYERSFLEEYEKNGMEGIKEKQAEGMFTNVNEYKAINTILSRYQYIYDFQETLAKMEEEYKIKTSISIFSDEDGYTMSSLKQTLKDYRRLNDVELKIGNDRILTDVISFKESHIIVIIFIFLITIQLYQERRKGLWSMIYSTPKGRIQLAMMRGYILISSVILFLLAMYGSMIIYSTITNGGVKELGRSVQSVLELKDFVYPMTIGSFFVVYVSIQILTALVLAMMFWLLFSCIRNYKVSILVLAMLFSVGYVLYTYIPIQSNIALLKYINLYYFIDVSESILSYQNINLIGHAINRLMFTVVVAVVFVVVVFFCTIGINHYTRPFAAMGKLEQVCEWGVIRWRRMVARMNLMGIELYKVLVWQRAGLILIVFAYLSISSIEMDQIWFTDEQYTLLEFSDAYSGPVTEEARLHVESLLTLYEQKEVLKKEAESKYQDGGITQEEYMAYTESLRIYDTYLIQYTVLTEKLDRVDQVEEQYGDSAIVNELGYEKLLGDKNIKFHQLLALKAMLCIILLCAGMYSYETKCGTKSVVRTTVYGRKPIFYKKIAIVGLLAMTTMLITYVPSFYQISTLYGLGNYSEKVYNLSFLTNNTLTCSIGTFLILVYTVRFVALFFFGVVTLFISSVATAEVSIIISTILLMGPSILSYIGMIDIKSIEFYHLVECMNLYLNKNDMVTVCLIGLLLCLVGGSYWISNRIWNSSKGGGK